MTERARFCRRSLRLQAGARLGLKAGAWGPGRCSLQECPDSAPIALFRYALEWSCLFPAGKIPDEIQRNAMLLFFECVRRGADADWLVATMRRSFPAAPDPRR